jgi:hypothetical protein
MDCERDRTRGGQSAVIEPGAGDDVASETVVGRREAVFCQRLPDGKDIVQLHMRQHDVLGVRDAQFVMGVALGQIRHHPHLFARGIARDAARSAFSEMLTMA